MTAPLELHHIKKRISNSPFNASPICHKCHADNGKLHHKDTENMLINKTVEFLRREGYIPTQKDKEFLNGQKKNNKIR